MRKDYSEKLLFIKDQFYEKLLTVRQCLVYSMDVLIVAEFDFKSFIKEIRIYERDTEGQIFQIIAQQSPNSRDLRLLLGILKSLNDLHRITKTINRISRVFNNYFSSTDLLDLNLFTNFDEMGKRLISMLDQIIDLYSATKVTPEKAELFQQELTQADDYIDSLFKDIYNHLITKIQIELDSKKQAKILTEILIVIRHMERLGDHLCNIAEKILYIETGDHFIIN